jgi:hypothetical protein
MQGGCELDGDITQQVHYNGELETSNLVVSHLMDML